jgi:hypothetical protein
MTIQDQVIGALCAWREQRGAGRPGLQSILNVLLNRTARDKTSVYEEATAKLQFSSLTAKGDPELTLWPVDADPQWQQALSLAAQAAAGTLADLTNGSTLYYAPASIPSGASITIPNGTTLPFPKGWNPDVVTYQVTIGGQVFFTEV